jgi:hypothetical protein
MQKWFGEIGVEELDWPAQRPDLNPIAHLWDELDAECEPGGLITQNQCPTSLMLLWLNGSKSPQQCLKKKPSQKSGGCFSSKGGTNSILMRMILE